jgi:predicted transcriptional regulator
MVTLMTCGGRPALPVKRPVDATPVIRMGASSHGRWRQCCRKKSSDNIVKRVLSSVVFRNMSSEEAGRDQLNLTDPKAMRAIAHPVRMALLDLLSVTPTLTATQASEVLGESPANCAFHLRTLAKYGFVKEAGGGKGRERPWAAAHRSINVTTTRQPDKHAELAAAELAHIWQERALEHIRQVFAANSWPDGWSDAVRSSNSRRFLTAAEAIQISDEFFEILDRYADRRDDPAARPAGALPVQFAYFVFPMPELASLGMADKPDHSEEK